MCFKLRRAGSFINICMFLHLIQSVILTVYNLAFGNRPHRILKALERFDEYYSCHLQGEYVWGLEALYSRGSTWRVGCEGP